MSQGGGAPIKRGLKSKSLLLVGLVILLFLLLNFSQTWFKNKEVNREMADLQKQASDLKQKNLELAQLINYLNSNAYIEEKARTDLGLKKEGEKTIIISENINNSTNSFNQ